MKADKQKIQVLNQLVDHYGFQHWWEYDNCMSDWVSMIFIQQTTEKNAKIALKNLEHTLTVEQLQKREIEELQKLISPEGFFKQKSQYIKALNHWFVSKGEDFELFRSYSTVELRKEILSIKGVGFETADALI